MQVFNVVCRTILPCVHYVEMWQKREVYKQNLFQRRKLFISPKRWKLWPLSLEKITSLVIFVFAPLCKIRSDLQISWFLSGWCTLVCLDVEKHKNKRNLLLLIHLWQKWPLCPKTWLVDGFWEISKCSTIPLWGKNWSEEASPHWSVADPSP